MAEQEFVLELGPLKYIYKRSNWKQNVCQPFYI